MLRLLKGQKYNTAMIGEDEIYNQPADEDPNGGDGIDD